MAAFVTDYFVRGAWWDRLIAEGRAQSSWIASRLGVLQHSVDILQKLDVDECIRIYTSTTWQSAWGDVLFVNTVSNRSNALLDVGIFSPGDSFYDYYSASIKRLSEDSQYCLAQPTREHCELRINLTLLYVVIACNVLKVVCLKCTLLAPNFEPLATVGDAIASFMNDPETLTAEKGPICAADVRGKQTDNWHSVFAQRTLLPWRNERRRWAKLVYWKEWTVCIAL